MKTKKILYRLFILAVGGTVLIGIPSYFDKWGLIFISWMPALVAMMYLEED